MKDRFYPDSCPHKSSGGLSLKDYTWDYSLKSLLETYNLTYQSNKTLPAKAYWDPTRKAYFLPYIEARGGDVRLPERFVTQIIQHIESAFAHKYIDAVFFPDMGHSHFLIPNLIWTKKYNPLPVSKFSKMYTLMMEDLELKILYHTAEQMRLIDENQIVIDDPYIKWRHKTRNLLGYNNNGADLKILQNPKSAVNTVNEYPKHFWFGAGFNISAHSDGCFAFQKNGILYRFDISLFDLED